MVKPKRTGRINATVTEEIQIVLDKYCEEHSKVKSKVVEKAVIEFLKKEGVIKNDSL